MMEEEKKLPSEDYRVVWREFFCAALSTLVPRYNFTLNNNSHETNSTSSGYVNNKFDFYNQDPMYNTSYHIDKAAEMADIALEKYIERRKKLREYNLIAFK